MASVTYLAVKAAWNSFSCYCGFEKEVEDQENYARGLEEHLAQ